VQTDYAGADVNAMASPRRALAMPSGAFAAAVIALLVMGLWLGLNDATLHTREVVSDLAFVVAPAIAAGCCWSAGRRSNPWRDGWSWVGRGCLTWAGATWSCGSYELGLGRYAPLPSSCAVPFFP